MCAGFLAAGVPAAAAARVERLEILDRTVFAEGFEFGPVGAYERIKGRLHFAVDPDAAANSQIVDLHLAPVDSRGLVTFSADFVLLKPVNPALGNGRLLYDVNNRGSLTALGSLNNAWWSNDPTGLAHAGNGFLMVLGYSILSSAWNWDVTEGDDRLQIALPIATEDGAAITGTIAAEITVNEVTGAMPFAWGFSRGYLPASMDHTQATLSWRLNPEDRRQAFPLDQWRFTAPTEVTLDRGFQPGLLYELVYRAIEPRVVGLGLGAIRDAISFFRFDVSDDTGEPNPLVADGVTPRAVIAYGVSQSGRVLQHMVLEALHVDEAGRMVFDTAVIHVAGGGKGSFNYRFAPTTRHQSPREDLGAVADFFPFATVPVTDPETGITASVLDRARQGGKIPKMVYTMTSTEYWTRSASLLHTDLGPGIGDVGLDSNARLYFIAGAQHNSGFGLGRGIFQQCRNPLDHRPIVRAVFLATDRWGTLGTEPPPSRYPTIAAGTLGTVAQYAARFPAIPGMALPAGNLQPRRLDLGPRFAGLGIADAQPAVLGTPFPTRVPLPDLDGLDLDGIRLAPVAVPLGTYTGWNLRNPNVAGTDGLGRWAGAFFPFATTAEARHETGDPRLSLAERYGSRQEFLSSTQVAADSLAAEGFILTPDIQDIVARAGRAYDLLVGDRPPDCEYLAGFGG